jgi:hypothetical protein
MQTNHAAKYTAAAVDAYVKYAATRDEKSAAYLLGRAAHYEVLAAAAKGQAIEAAPVAVAAEAVAAKVEKPRCPHYKAIQQFMAIAREAGLNTSAKDRCRGAVGALLGRRIESRADLTGAEWAAMGAAVKAGKLVW